MNHGRSGTFAFSYEKRKEMCMCVCMSVCVCVFEREFEGVRWNMHATSYILCLTLIHFRSIVLSV